MTVDLANISLDDINLLTAKLSDVDVDIQDLIAALESDDPIVAFSETLKGEPVFPMQWGRPKFHAFAYNTESRWKWPERTTLEDDGLMYTACADCNTHAWIRFRGIELHLSTRMTEFVQIAADLQIKALSQGILLRRPRLFKNLNGAGAAD